MTETDKTFTCARCHYETKVAQYLKRHLSRVHPCEPLHSNEDPKHLLDAFNASISANKLHKCVYCDKGFSHRQSKSVHQKSCLQRRNVTLEERVKQLEDMLSKRENNVTITNNFNNNSQTINQIQINAFSKEDPSHILKNKHFLDQCVRRTNKGLVELADKMHFDKNKPENNNLRITNKKHPFIQYHNGNKWMYEKKDKILNQVIDHSYGIMQDHFDDNEHEIKNNMSNAMFSYIKEWMEKMSDKDKEVIEPLLEDLHILILNGGSS
jgi:hypothetical protein